MGNKLFAIRSKRLEYEINQTPSDRFIVITLTALQFILESYTKAVSIGSRIVVVDGQNEKCIYDIETIDWVKTPFGYKK